LENTNTPTPGQNQFTNRLDWLSPITDTFVEAFANDTLIIDCPKILLTQQGADVPRVISGRGMISLQENTSFQLRMYTDLADADPFAEMDRMSNWVPGEIIPDDEFYNLDATDISGTTWHSKNIYVNLHGQNHGVVATGHFDLLTHGATGLSVNLPSVLSMWFFEALEVPFTRLVKMEETSGERKLRTSISPKFSTFEVGPFNFEIRSTEMEKGTTLLRTSSTTDPFPVGIESRILEALRYVTFSPVGWCIVDKQHGGVREVSIMPKNKKIKGLFEEPLNSNRPDCGVDYWRLFSAYLRHVMNYDDEDRYHPLSAQLFQVITAETREMHILGLLVSVAVEGVLNCEFNSLANPSKDFLDSIDSAIKLIDRIKCTNTNLATRIKGAMSPMKSARAKDKLKLLQENGIVSKQMVSDWEKLRNTTAHASVHDNEKDIQETWSRCNTVYTLLNILVFTAIGYSGKYQDFSSRGWPIKDFRLASS